MRISLTTAVLLILGVVSQTNPGAQAASAEHRVAAAGAEAPRIRLAPRNVETDPMYIHSCAIEQPAHVLESLWEDLGRRIKGNKEYPGQLVRDIVDLACVQRNLYAYSVADGARPDLKARFSNNIVSFLVEVVDNFKLGMKRFLGRLEEEEAGEITYRYRAVPARDLLSIDPLLAASEPKSFRSNRERVHGVIREFVDIHAMIVERFVSAYPLLIHVAQKIETTNDVFKGKLPKRAAAISVPTTTGAPRTISRPTGPR